MRKLNGSIIAFNRKAFVLLSVMLGLVAFGVLGWRIEAQRADEAEKRMATIRQDLSKLSPAKLARRLKDDENERNAVSTVAKDAVPEQFRPAETQGNPVIFAYNAETDRVVSFNANTPGTFILDAEITGLDLVNNEYISGIDFRPSNGQLYGIASKGFPNTDRVVTINTTTAAATFVAPNTTFVTTQDTFFGTDFNPVPDAIRQSGDADTNRRISPVTGALLGTDTTLVYAAGDPGFGVNPNVVHVAYSNNTAGVTTTTLYGIDSNRDTLVRIGGIGGTPSPNTGQVTTIGSLGVNATGFGAFDIQQGTDIAYAILNLSNEPTLARINLATGAATVIGVVGDGSGRLDGMAIQFAADGGSANLGITKTDGVASVAPGGATTYTIVASNAGPDPVINAIVADTFPTSITSVTWTCTATGGASCSTAAGTGNISSAVSIPMGGTVTFSAVSTVSASATGTIANTASIAPPTGVTDPTTANNSATDTNTVGGIAPTPTPSPVATPTPTPTPTPVVTPTPTPTRTPTPTPTPTPAASPTPTPTPAATPTPSPSPVPSETIYGITVAGGLFSFNSTTPGTVTAPIAITGIVAGQTLAGADFRPATGELFAMSYNATTGASQLYTINLTTAVATPVGTGFTIVPGVNSNSFGFDFNPLVDRIRLIAGSNATAANNGANYRLNPNNGAIAGTDTSVAYAAGDPSFGTTPSIAAAAYTNNVSGGTTTTLYAFNWQNDDLVRVGSLNGAPVNPNSGQLFTVGDSGIVTNTRTLGMDISGASSVAYGNLDPTGTANDSFFTFNLASGAVTNRGLIGAGIPVLDISVGITPPTTTLGFAAGGFNGAYRDDESQSVSIVINRTGSTTGATSATVNFSGGNAAGGAACATGVDYVNTAQTVNFPAGSQSQTVMVPLCGDVLADTNETFNVSISGVPAGTGVLGTTMVTINDTANQFRNTTAVAINQGTSANPYPSNITVSGATNNTFRIRVTLYDLYHDQPDNIDALLVGPNGAKYILMADTGGSVAVTENGNVTLTFADYPSAVLPDAGPLVTGIFQPTACEPVVGNFPAPAPAAPYVTPPCVVSRTNAQTLYGNFGNTTANGTWSLYIRDDNNLARPLSPQILRGQVLGGWGIELLASTSAGVEVSGRIMTGDGRGLRNAVVKMTDSSGNTRIATTGSFGYYRFEDIEVGSTQIVTVESRRYNYGTRLVQVLDTLTDVDFMPID